MLLFHLKRIAKLGVKSLWMHRLRSTLTMLGIIFGVCSVIAMLAIGEGASQAAQEAIARLGSTNLIIETAKPPEKQTDTGKVETVHKYGLTYADAESIHNTIPDIEVVVPVREIAQQEARYLNHPKVAVKVIGTIPWYTEISPVQLIRGRFLSSTDLHHQQNVCVIDEEVARKLFIFDDPMNEDIRIQGNYYRVVGVVGASASADVQNEFGKDIVAPVNPSGGVIGNIYVPLTTAKTRFTELSASFSGGSESIERVELQKIIVKVDSIEQVLPMRDILNASLTQFHDKSDYHIAVPLEQLRQAARTKRIFSIVLGSIAAISLLVGGIGIMNIMLATISERTREVGIRRALGARKRDIIVQFLSETLLLTLTGGILGIVFGSLIPFLVTYFGRMPTIITASSLVLAFGISALVGIAFGLYPAYRAANMD
ncbi:MAG: ABC transporter permease, partial [Sedimentisphaerales bacterium]|nr:ABC transporter permease [Sedimentisphaerales bacterium]